jgi:hypothetical protein
MQKNSKGPQNSPKSTLSCILVEMILKGMFFFQIFHIWILQDIETSWKKLKVSKMENEIFFFAFFLEVNVNLTKIKFLNGIIFENPYFLSK